MTFRNKNVQFFFVRTINVTRERCWYSRNCKLSGYPDDRTFAPITLHGTFYKKSSYYETFLLQPENTSIRRMCACWEVLSAYLRVKVLDELAPPAIGGSGRLDQRLRWTYVVLVTRLIWIKRRHLIGFTLNDLPAIERPNPWNLPFVWATLQVAANQNKRPLPWQPTSISWCPTVSN